MPDPAGVLNGLSFSSLRLLRVREVHPLEESYATLGGITPADFARNAL